MNSGKTVFAQLMDFIPAHEFRGCVARYRGQYRARSFSSWDQFLCIAFARLTYRESLRDIETWPRALGGKLCHLGIRGHISRSRLADANEPRDWHIFADLARALITTARPLYAGDPLGVEREETAYALNCTTIDLCLSLFPWAHYRRLHAAVRRHALLDLRGNIPVGIDTKPAKIDEIRAFDPLLTEPGAFYLLDRAYLDFARLYTLTQYLAFFIIRARKDFRFRCVTSHAVDKTTGLRCDQTIRLVSFYPLHGYPEHLRRIRYCDRETDCHLIFLTNNFSLPTLTIPQLYKCRWQVELFFKWIKQHLRIKAFYGVSENAVKTQICTAIAVYVLVAIVRKRLGLDLELYAMLQILSVSLFEKVPLSQILTQTAAHPERRDTGNQLQMFIF
jgi:hypothetical protein